ncbi:sulfatase [Brachyspira pilosicoli]|uniref:Sulfatase n=2 Tax=Brachyspira pilosicoli TaxID=52584 RepID=A0AAJ6GBM4_BRAPL|nr:sulfatase [Brachyspira pilosicoli]WIH94019.1 sulfatase [Brachyspira pilosicoli]
MAITFQNTILLFNDMPNLYPTLINVLSLPMKIVTITATIIYFSAMLLLITAFIYNIKRFRKKTIIFIIISISISSYIIFFRPRNIEIWNVDFKGNANKNGIVDTINYKINYDKTNSQKHSKKEVENALLFLVEKEKNRDVSDLLVEGSKNNKRDIFLIFLESFYDYSHFVNIFDKDPFPEEYRKWANASQKTTPNTVGGSFYARLAGLTASSPLYPKTQSEKINNTLISLLNEEGYYTLALEEAWHSYNLNNFLPSICFQNIIFELGTTNIDSYIKNNLNNFNKPIFVYGFTILGHTGSHVGNDFNIAEKNKKFMNYFNENDKLNLIETIDNSVITAMEIIKTRDTILQYSPNALIIFKHDHLYPYLRAIVERSTIDENIKKSFLEDNSPSPLLIWDGTNGAYKAPVNIVPENIPMFIAINAGATNYKNSIISLLYKENIDNTISTYHKYYKITNNSLIIENNIDENSEIFKYENAQKILSQDIFQGKKYYYELIDNLEKTN